MICKLKISKKAYDSLQRSRACGLQYIARKEKFEQWKLYSKPPKTGWLGSFDYDCYSKDLDPTVQWNVESALRFLDTDCVSVDMFTWSEKDPDNKWGSRNELKDLYCNNNPPAPAPKESGDSQPVRKTEKRKRKKRARYCETCGHKLSIFRRQVKW